MALHELGPGLRLLRSRSGLNQEAVAKLAKLDPAMLSRYERGAVRPSIESLVAILAGLGRSLSDLDAAIEEAAGRAAPMTARSNPHLVSAFRSLQIVDEKKLAGFLLGYAQRGLLDRSLAEVRESAAEVARETVEEVAASLASGVLAVAEGEGEYSSGTKKTDR